MSKYRLIYEKNDEVKYLGHLDTMTMFDRTFRRADIKLKFSQGFNPKPNIVFALPSGSGLISKSEIIEIELEEDVEENKLIERLNNNLPNGFNIITANYVTDNKSLMAKVIESEYEVYIKFEHENNKDELAEKVIDIFNSNEILVDKKVKPDKPKVDIDIKSFIINVYVEKYVDNDEYDICIKMKAKAGSKDNLRPDYIIQAIEKNGLAIYDYQIIRTNLILNE